MEKQIIDDKIKELFISSRVIALVGASKKKEKDSNIVMKFLQKSGYKVIPVNPTCINDTIHGERVYGTLLDIEPFVIFPLTSFAPEHSFLLINLLNSIIEIGSLELPIL